MSLDHYMLGISFLIGSDIYFLVSIFFLIKNEEDYINIRTNIGEKKRQ